MMVLETSKANAILTVLQGCNNLTRLKKIQAHVIVNGLQNHPAISNSILNFCAVSISGSLPYAQHLFKHILNPQTQAWNSIIRGFAQSPSPVQAIFYYNRMLFYSVSGPDTFTFSFTLKACERVKALKKCEEVHGSIIRTGYERDVVVCTGLAGYHQEALRIYDYMRNENVGFDGFTLVGLLSSCSHVGALNMGVKLHRIASEKGLLRNVFVGNALIDMYAKCGDSPWQDDPVLWRILLSSSKIHKNVVIGEIAMRNLSQLGAVNAGDCVLLATIYAGANDEQGVARMRKLIKKQGIKTTPGWSWVEVSDQVEAKDPASGPSYYCNESTGKNQWEMPNDTPLVTHSISFTSFRRLGGGFGRIYRVLYYNSGHTHHQGLFCERMPRVDFIPSSSAAVPHVPCAWRSFLLQRY
ncbi:hypothetical protein D5086_028803 [Populus alba]|uniref:Uncharacterized protein n=1 Tax=Populus alba TaxID=43335 RepID=A0ACC4ARS2_POPAL